MKLIREPSVYLVGSQIVDELTLNKFFRDQEVVWQSDTEVQAESLIEVAGRVCYMSFNKPRPGGNKAYIDHILEVGHGSVIEHAVYNFIFSGVSRSLSHELVRHRAGWSYSQLSQRYVDESVAEYVEPDIIAEDNQLHEIWINTINSVHQAYKTLVVKLVDKVWKNRYEEYLIRMNNIDVPPMKFESFKFSEAQEAKDKTGILKQARQAARSVLPNATETKIFCTANARAIRHFIELRANRNAEVEIRKLANKLYEIMLKESPHLFNDYIKEQLNDGTFEVTTKNKKV